MIFFWLFKILVTGVASLSPSLNNYDYPYCLLCPVITIILHSGKFMTKLIILYRSFFFLRMGIENKEGKKEVQK